MARIAIIGAGPAGSATALHLLRRGVDPDDITLFDRARFPRQKLCGGALSHRGTQALLDLVGEAPAGRLATRGLSFRSRFGQMEVREGGDQWLYDRAVLDADLLQRCVDAGVRTRTGCRVTGVEGAGSGCTVAWTGGREPFDWVVGADGALGITRRASTLPDGPRGRLVEGIFEPGNASLDPTRLLFDFDPVVDGIPGYAWAFPYPQDATGGPRWKLGIMDGRGRVSGRHLRRWTRAFAERHGFRPVDVRIDGWPERYFVPGAPADRGRLLLVGEAWGIDPLLGEGIATALFMADYAARRIRRALDRRDDRAGGYARGFAATPEGRNLAMHAIIAWGLYTGPSVRRLRNVFQLRALSRLAGRGTEDYGRLLGHAPGLLGHYLVTSLRNRWDGQSA